MHLAKQNADQKKISTTMFFIFVYELIKMDTEKVNMDADLKKIIQLFSSIAFIF